MNLTFNPEKLKAANIRAKFLSGKIGVANSQFVDILNGKRRITPRIALALEKELGVRAIDLVRQQAEYELLVERLELTGELTGNQGTPAKVELLLPKN